MYSEKDLIYKKEEVYFALLLSVSILTYLTLILSIVGIPIIAVIVLFYWFIHNLSIVSIRKNGVKISEHQFPEFYEKAVVMAQKMELKTMPDIYVIQSGGILNAFATKFGLKNMVVLYSDIFELLEEQGEREVFFVLAHEFAHLKRKHVGNGWLLFPSLTIPFLGNAYSRACEFTCDRYGAHYSESADAAKNALTILAIGHQLYKKVDQTVFTQQIVSESGVFSWIDEKLSTHPNLPRRIYELNKFFNASETATIHTSSKNGFLAAGLMVALVTIVVSLSTLFFVIIGEIAELDEGVNDVTEETGYNYDMTSMNPLMLAVAGNDFDNIETFAADKTMLSETSDEGYTALHVAVMDNNYEAAEYLLQQGADPNTVDVYSYTPLMEAIAYENIEMVKLLLTSGAD